MGRIARGWYLASVSLTGSLAGGTASMFGGVLAEWFSSRQMSLLFQWASPTQIQNVTVIQVQHWEFLFAISFVLGFYVMHALSRISEGRTISQRRSFRNSFSKRSAASINCLRSRG